MAVTLISVKCPACGASLSIEEGRQQVFCSYCGSKVLVNNDHEYVYRHIDEAAIKKAEADKAIRLKELEIKEKEREQKRKDKARRRLIRIILVAVWIVSAAVLLLLGSDSDTCLVVGMTLVAAGVLVVLLKLAYILHRGREREAAERRAAGLIKLDVDMREESLKSKTYAVLAGELRSLGFNNIQCVNLHDLLFGRAKEGKVERITIGGKEAGIFTSNKWFKPNVMIAIYYHGRR